MSEEKFNMNVTNDLTLRACTFCAARKKIGVEILLKLHIRGDRLTKYKDVRASRCPNYV